MAKKFYEAPEMEMLQLTVEAGFAQSGGSGDSTGSNSGFEWGDN